jgi:hypothetical protein
MRAARTMPTATPPPPDSNANHAVAVRSIPVAAAAVKLEHQSQRKALELKGINARHDTESSPPPGPEQLVLERADEARPLSGVALGP